MKPHKTPVVIVPDAVFVPRNEAARSFYPYRRIIGVVQGRVIYSTGSDRNRDCLVRTFETWCRRVAARNVHAVSAQTDNPREEPANRPAF